MALSVGLRPQRRPDINLVDMDGELLLRDARRKTIHILNRTAQVIWELCDGQHSAPEMAQALRSRFRISAERDVLADVLEALQVFADKNLLSDEG